MSVTFVAVGALLLHRRPANRIGWIVLFAGVFASAGFASYRYALESFAHRPGPLPLGGFAAWAANLIVGAHLVYLVMGLLFLLFPDGHLPSPSWRRLVWVGGVVYGSLA